MSTGRAHMVDKLGRFTPKSVPAREFGPGDVGFVIAGIKEIDGAPVGDTITLEYKQATEPAAGLQAGAAARVRRHVPDRLRRLRQVPRCAVEAAAQRLGAALRTRGVHRARLRFPRRLPRPAAHGHRAGAARARIPDRADHLRAHRHLRSEEDRRQGRVRRQPDQTTAGRPDRRAARAHHHRQHPRAARSRRRRAAAVQRKARPAEEDAVPRQPGVAAIRDAARRSGARLLRPPEVAPAAATPRSTTTSATSKPRRWSSSTS